MLTKTFGLEHVPSLLTYISAFDSFLVRTQQPETMKIFYLSSLLAGFSLVAGDASSSSSPDKDAAWVSSQGDIRLVSSSSSAKTIGGAQSYAPAIKSRVTIPIPANVQTLHDDDTAASVNGGVGHELARFGLIKARGSMTRFVYYTDHSLCGNVPAIDVQATYPNITAGLVHPFFLLAKDDSASCTAVRMARNAQAYGASALILGQEQCRCQDKKNCVDKFKQQDEGTPQAQCVDDDPPLVDDGSASDVTIPTVLLRRQTAEALYNVFKGPNGAPTNQTVMMELTWGLPLTEHDLPEFDDDDAKGNDKLWRMLEPHYHLWTSAYDPLFNSMGYQHLRTLAKAFGPSIHFSPRYLIQDGALFGCTAYSGADDDDKAAPDDQDVSPCHGLCTNHGRYCANRVNEDISGKQVVEETLRRLCIYRHYPAFANDSDDPDKKKKKRQKNEQIQTAYWDYVIYHMDHCTQDPTQYGDEKCIERAFKEAKVDKSVIDSCMKETVRVRKITSGVK